MGVILFLHSPTDIDSAEVTIKDTTVQAVTVSMWLHSTPGSQQHSDCHHGQLSGDCRLQHMSWSHQHTDYCHGQPHPMSQGHQHTSCQFSHPSVTEPPTCRLSPQSAPPHVTGPPTCRLSMWSSQWWAGASLYASGSGRCQCIR